MRSTMAPSKLQKLPLRLGGRFSLVSLSVAASGRGFHRSTTLSSATAPFQTALGRPVRRNLGPTAVPAASFSTSLRRLLPPPPQPPRRGGGYNYSPYGRDEPAAPPPHPREPHPQGPWAHLTPEEYAQLDPRLRDARPLFDLGIPTSSPHHDQQQQRPRSRWARVARSTSTYYFAAAGSALAVFFYWYNLETVPVSGRRRFNCYSRGSVDELGKMQAKRIEYEVEHMQGGRFLPDNDPRTAMVRRVMNRLIPVSGMRDAEWKVRVIDDPKTANAFVLPGGKVFVFSGILRVARNDHGLATVLGHEISHNLASHLGERMSESVGMNFLLAGLLAVPGVSILGFLALRLFGGTLLDLVFSLPMNRVQESEADYIGLMMMAEACYDPREAVEFWRRMDSMQQLQPPEWLSTHPSNRHRIEKITQFLPQAEEKRQQSDCKGTSTFADLFRRALDAGIIISTDAAETNDGPETS